MYNYYYKWALVDWDTSSVGGDADGLEYNKKALSIDRISAMAIVTGLSRWLGVDMI